MQRYLLFFLLSIFIVFTPAVILAQMPSSPSAAVSSYELFWPLTSGRTADDSLYFLKSFKEKLQSLITFTPVAKASNDIFLGTKRILEAEKLLKIGKNDLALKTIDRAKKNFQQSLDNYQKARENSKSAKLDVQARDRLQSLTIFLPKLSKEKSQDTVSKLGAVEDIIRQVLATP